MPRTTRQRLEQHRVQATCGACHSKMDPLGLPFEIFDEVGKLRTTENGLPIVTAGDLDGKPFDGPRALAELLATSPKVSACTVSRFYRYASGAEPNAQDVDRLTPLQQAFAKSEGRFRSLVLAYVGGSLFSTVSDQP